MPDRIRARLASGNPNKLRELRLAAPELELELLDAGEFPPEDGETFYDNARGKAVFGRKLGEPGALVLGEDSGLQVDALGGAPGLRSSRWAGPGEDGVAKVLSELRGVAWPERGARYVCVLVGLFPDGRETRGTGTLEGRIATAARGSEGFGYDPVFVPAGETRTVAGLGNEWKAENSHRARAARALVEALRAGGEL